MSSLRLYSREKWPYNILYSNFSSSFLCLTLSVIYWNYLIIRFAVVFFIFHVTKTMCFVICYIVLKISVNTRTKIFHNLCMWCVYVAYSIWCLPCGGTWAPWNFHKNSQIPQPVWFCLKKSYTNFQKKWKLVARTNIEAGVSQFSLMHLLVAVVCKCSRQTIFHGHLA